MGVVCQVSVVTTLRQHARFLLLPSSTPRIITTFIAASSSHAAAGAVHCRPAPHPGRTERGNPARPTRAPCAASPCQLLHLFIVPRPTDNRLGAVPLIARIARNRLPHGRHTRRATGTRQRRNRPTLPTSPAATTSRPTLPTRQPPAAARLGTGPRRPPRVLILLGGAIPAMRQTRRQPPQCLSTV